MNSPSISQSSLYTPAFQHTSESYTSIASDANPLAADNELRLEDLFMNIDDLVEDSSHLPLDKASSTPFETQYSDTQHVIRDATHSSGYPLHYVTSKIGSHVVLVGNKPYFTTPLHRVRYMQPLDISSSVVKDIVGNPVLDADSSAATISKIMRMRQDQAASAPSSIATMISILSPASVVDRFQAVTNKMHSISPTGPFIPFPSLLPTPPFSNAGSPLPPIGQSMASSSHPTTTTLPFDAANNGGNSLALKFGGQSQ